MSLPIVAIVGRPNVGKSSLFNWLVGRRISIVDPTAGVTRDRVSAIVKVQDKHFELVDTGGMGIQDQDNLTAEVERQIHYALMQAALILFVVDTRDGVVPLDEVVAERLRGITKPIILTANKADTDALRLQASDFFRLGYGNPIPVSAEQKLGRQELLSEIVKMLPEAASLSPAPAPVELQLAIVGRRNVGKSTFINSLAQAERVIVSEVPGTTRDSIDVRFERDNKTFIAIDTAGVRRKSSIADNIEFYSLARAERSIRRADVVLHFFDPRLRISKVDKQLAEYILDNHKPAIFVVNKWDLAREQIPTEKWSNYLRTCFPMLDHVPIAFITAKSGKNVYKLLNLAQQLHKQAGKRVGTGDLNRVIRGAVEANPPPLRANRLPKIFYAVQTDVYPPTIVLFTNGPDLFDLTYQRYLTKVLRDNLPFPEVAIKLVLRARQGSDLVENDSLRAADTADADSSAEEMPTIRPARPIRAIQLEEPPREPDSAEPRRKPREKPPRKSETWKDI